MNLFDGHRRCVAAVKFLALAAIEKANSGHPGVVLGFADVLTVLWRQHMRYDLEQVTWANRDRFVLSNGHASALYYAVLHCCGFDLTVDDLRSFRQLNSRTPGHPERDEMLGIDVTTGPLGQGLANGVGMALAQQYLSACDPEHGSNACFDYYTYVAVGDGCLMEGISHEACALAGRFGLGRLIVCWDDNGISIDGACERWAEQSVPDRFLSYGWHVIADVDGHDPNAIDCAIQEAKNRLDKPSMICFKTVIAEGTDLAGQASSHGKPLGFERVNALKSALDWGCEDFFVPESVYALWRQNQRQGRATHWQQFVANLPDDSVLRTLVLSQGVLCDSNWNQRWHAWLNDAEVFGAPQASRHSSQWILNQIVPREHAVLGGSADLTESTGVLLTDVETWLPQGEPKQFLSFGVREFAMFAMANGLATCSGLRPFVSTFLVFSDYGINAVRMAAMMRLPVIFVFSHDSVFVGEDGPTHQPIEQLSHLRTIPNLQTWRPADGFETGMAWKQMLERNDGPSCLVLSRQKLPSFGCDQRRFNAEYGGYRLDTQQASCSAQGVLIATGSEVALAMAVQQHLLQQGIRIAVVSMPCVERFLQASKAYQDQVLSPGYRYRVILEAGSGQCWYRFLQGVCGQVVSIDQFGVCGPGQSVYERFGFDIESVCDVVLSLHKSASLV